MARRGGRFAQYFPEFPHSDIVLNTVFFEQNVFVCFPNRRGIVTNSF
jgi:hypothetical protein